MSFMMKIANQLDNGTIEGVDFSESIINKWKNFEEVSDTAATLRRMILMESLSECHCPPPPNIKVAKT